MEYAFKKLISLTFLVLLMPFFHILSLVGPLPKTIPKLTQKLDDSEVYDLKLLGKVAAIQTLKDTGVEGQEMSE